MKKLIIIFVTLAFLGSIIVFLSATETIGSKITQEKKRTAENTFQPLSTDPMKGYADNRLIKPATTLCHNYLMPFEVSVKWQDTNKMRLRSVVSTALSNGLTGEELEHVSFATKIHPLEMKELIGLYSFNNGILPMIAGNDGAVLSKKIAWDIYNFVLDGELDKIVTLVEKGLIIDKVYIVTKAGQYSLIGTVLTANVSLDNKINAVEAIVTIGTTITYLDLFVATQQNMPIQFIEKLWSASGLDASFTLMLSTGDEKSLAQVAIENGNVELLDFWLSNGGGGVIVPFERSLLDLLPPALSPEEQEQQTALFLTLMRHGVLANDENTRYKLSAWLSDDIYKDYQHKIEVEQPISVSIINQPHVQKALEDIFLRYYSHS